jgi:hypothetical protein
VSIRAFKVRTASLTARRNIPTSTSLVSNEWQLVRLCYSTYKLGIIEDGSKTIVDRESSTFEIRKSLGEIGRQFWKDEARSHVYVAAQTAEDVGFLLSEQAQVEEGPSQSFHKA